MTSTDLAHGLRRMTGRDPDESHRAATPLELLYDLAFVVAFGAAGSQLAHTYAENHVGAGLAAFGLSVFAICWAWINMAWFASAFDTDDWAYRLLTMVQMCGVVIVALGLPPMFASIVDGGDIDNRTMVSGYVVMRVPMVFHWLRAAKGHADRRKACNTYVVTIVAAQVLWCLLVVVDLPVATFFALAIIPFVVELVGPLVAEFRFGGTPWHPHHIAERYGLLAIITLGEGVIGTVAAMSAFVNPPGPGWTAEAITLLAAGIALTFGMWWAYFSLPWADLLSYHRERAFFWGYGHIFVFGSIAAVGAGLHAVQYFLEHHSKLSATETLLTVAVPTATFIGMIYLMYAVSLRAFDAFHLVLLAITAVVLGVAVAGVAAGWNVTVGVAIVALAPAVSVVGYEVVGHRHGREHVERLRATARTSDG